MKKNVTMMTLAGMALWTGSAMAQTPYSPNGSTMLLYHLNEISGTTAVDSSGNNRDAVYEIPKVVLGLPSASASLGTAISSGPSEGGTRTCWTDTKGADSVLLPATTTDFTVEAWVKMSGGMIAKTQRIAVVQPVGDTKVDWSFEIIGSGNQYHAGALSVSDSAVSNRVFKGGGMTWDANTWYHVAFVYDDLGDGTATYSLYRTAAGDTTADLVLSTTTDKLVSNSATGNRMFNIANFYGDSGLQLFNGSVDEVQLSSVARTAADFSTTLAVPEPAAVGLISIGLGALMLKWRHRAGR